MGQCLETSESTLKMKEWNFLACDGFCYFGLGKDNLLYITHKREEDQKWKDLYRSHFAIHVLENDICVEN